MKILRPHQTNALHMLKHSLAREEVIDGIQWRRISKFPRYWVSAGGEVFSTVRAGRLLAKTKTPQGYFYVSLLENGKAEKVCVHRLVAEQFIPGTGECVNHINGVKTDNCIKNLEWCSFKENNDHARDTNLVKNFGDAHYAAKLTAEIVRKIRDLVSDGMYHRDAAALFGVNRQQVTKIVNGKAWRRA